MLVAALDTTTRLGSLALVRDGAVVASRVGDPAAPHATRLPGDLLFVLEESGLAIRDVDVFAVVAGPGSFTGLRIGIAAVQGLAYAAERPVVGVSAFDALSVAAGVASPALVGAPIAMWLDAQRHEVFAAVAIVSVRPESGGLLDVECIEPPSVESPAALLERWMGRPWWPNATLAGDGTTTYRQLLLDHELGEARIVSPTPRLAPAAGLIAHQRATAGLGVLPHAVAPIYVRRPDAELARDRARAGA
jgi:tRNA threonylcarbamoyladenosine biosynthesis protein TsaB